MVKKANVALLYVAQVVRLLSPVIILPYLTKILDPGEWGLLALVQAYVLVISTCVESGFGISAARHIAVNRQNKSVISITVTSVISLQIMLTLLVSIVVAVIQFHGAKVAADPALLWFGVLAGVLQGFSLLWYFRGIDDILFASLVEIISKILYVFLVLFFVKFSSHLWLVTGLLFLVNLIAFTLMLWNIKSRIALHSPNISQMLKLFKLSLPFFLLRISAICITAGNTIILGKILPLAEVGYFAIAEKIMSAVRALYTPIIDSTLPNISAKIQSNAFAEVKEFLLRLGFWLFVISSLLSSAIYLLAPTVVDLFLSKTYSPVVELLRYFSIVPLIIAISSVIGPMYLLPCGKDKSFSISVILGSISSLVITYFFAPHFGALGGVLGILFSYIIILLSFIIILFRFNVQQNSNSV